LNGRVHNYLAAFDCYLEIAKVVKLIQACNFYNGLQEPKEEFVVLECDEFGQDCLNCIFIFNEFIFISDDECRNVLDVRTHDCNIFL
jgi:hypothetical protein